MNPLLLALLGFAVVAVILFFVIRNLEAVIFWSALCAPAIGANLASVLVHLFSGDYQMAMDSLKMLPFFMATLDNVFFTQTEIVYVYVGFAFVLIWTYIIARYAVKKFGIWALLIIPTMIWGIGLTLPNMREKLMAMFPDFAFLFNFYGIPALILITFITFGACYLIWRKSFSA
jgi:hypothetical protein